MARHGSICDRRILKEPGFANRCPECSQPENAGATGKQRMDADERKSVSEANEARRQAIKNLLYRKDS